MSEAYGILGLGLVGGSLAAALRERGARLIAVDPDAATRARALDQSMVDVALAAPGPELAEAALVVLCMPLGALAETLTAMVPHLRRDVLVTDVIGVKAAVERMVLDRLPGVAFVGGHPMAGGELGGFGQARPDLFSGKSVAVCAPPGRDREAQRVADMWRKVGGEPVLLSAQQHDELVALTSHLPYVAGLALVRLIAEAPDLKGLFGRGLVDATRRAAFAPEIMAAPVAANPHVPAMLRKLAAALNEIAAQCEGKPEELVAVAALARAAADRLVKPRF